MNLSWLSNMTRLMRANVYGKGTLPWYDSIEHQ